jgi:SAM-dependent methyltransferase
MAECFLCKKESERTVWRERAYEGRLCSCGMVYTTPSPPPGSIDFTNDPHPRDFYACSADYKAAWIARHCPRGRLLEIGCGEGFLLDAARRRGYEVFGMEPHAGRARLVKEGLGITVQESFIEEARLLKKEFDVIYHCDMLAHFPDPIGCLRLMASALRDGGVLCIEVGVLGAVSPLWYRLIGEIGLGPHLWLYSEQALRSLFAQAGLTVQHVQCFGLGPYVVMNKVAGLIEAAAFRLLSALRVPGAWLSRTKVNRLHSKMLSFIHYRIGAVTPRVGPLKLLVVARPTKPETTHA